MSQRSLEEYIPRVRERYARMTGRKARGAVLDEFCAASGFSRKHAIKVLNGQKRSGKGPGRGGAPPKYGPDCNAALKHCWLAMEQPCGKRMVGMLPLWLPHLEEVAGEPLSAQARAELLEVSAATIDRHLSKAKAGKGRKPLVPRSDGAVKALVEIRAERWATREVGWTEVDTVAHCGGDMAGSFIWSLTSVEILSGWTEIRCIWNCGQHATLAGLEDIGRTQPFLLRGIDSDGGGEFINYHLYEHLQALGIKQTRSRPYRKNDQAHVEQKNYTHVRQLLGYERLGHQELVEPLNELMREWSLWKNLFCTTMEQLSCTRVGSTQKRRHVKRPQTPAQRLLATDQLSPMQRHWLKEQLESHNPFEMKAHIEQLLAKVWKKRTALLKAEAKLLQELTWKLSKSEQVSKPKPRRRKRTTQPQPKATSELALGATPPLRCGASPRPSEPNITTTKTKTAMVSSL